MAKSALSTTEPWCRSQHQGSDFATYSRFALCCASRKAALATTAVILLAVVGKAAGDATDAAAGQRISNAAGSLSGSPAPA